MKIIRVVSTFALLFVLAGCSKDSLTPVSVQDAMVSPRAREYVTKPIELRVEAITDPSSGRIACQPLNTGASAPAAGWMQGHITHLGLLNMPESPWAHGSCELIFDENWKPVKVVIRGSHGRWTGANGDRLDWQGSYESYLDGTFSGDLDIVGGTGRFEGATGNLKGNGYVDPQTGYAVSRGEGYITIPK